MLIFVISAIADNVDDIARTAAPQLWASEHRAVLGAGLGAAALGVAAGLIMKSRRKRAG